MLIVFIPFIGGGGVEKNVFLISNFLSKKVKNVKICTISKKFKKKFNSKIKFICPKKNYSENLNIRIKYLICLYELFKFLKSNKNSVVLSFQANIYCIIICKIFSIKIITRSNSAPIGWSKNFIKRYIFKICLKLADEVMVNSFEFKSKLKKEFNISPKVIYNPLNFKEIKKLSKEKCPKIFKRKAQLKILNIGRFTEQKDQLTLLKAINIIKSKLNIELIIIGRGMLENKLKNFVIKNKLTKFVKFEKFTKNPYAKLKQTEVFVLSSRFEGLPNVLLEALVLKKFVISSSCQTGPKEILLNGKGGLLFKVGDYRGLANKILFYVSNKSECKYLLKKSYKSLNRFNSDTNLKKYFYLVKNFL